MYKYNLIFRSCLLFAFVDCSLQATIKLNETRTIRDENEWGASCYPGSECMVISRCNTDDFSLETILPCGSEKGGILLVCCPIRKASISEQTTVSLIIPSTASPTTIVPTTTAPRKANTSIWSKLSKRYQEKAKLLPTKCGINDLQNKISAGSDSELGQFPWMVLLGYNVNNDIQYFCGGTIINNKYVLTAAHCTNVSSYIPTIARFGEWNISSDLDCIDLKDEAPDCALPVVDIEIEQIIPHERFGDNNLPSFQNDIALLRLKHEIKFTDFVSPVCLAPDVYNSFSTKYTISGWGLTEKNPDIPNPVLQYAEISYYDFNECNSIAPPQTKPLVNTQFCAGGDAESSCRGDSGGPLTYVSPSNNKIFQKGIISLGTSYDCNTEGRPNIFTEVSKYIQWILDKIQK